MNEPPRIGRWTRFTDFCWFIWNYWHLAWPYRDAVHAMAGTFTGEPLPPEGGVYMYRTWIEPTGCYYAFSRIEDGRPLHPATESSTTNATGSVSAHTFVWPSKGVP